MGDSNGMMDDETKRTRPQTHRPNVDTTEASRLMEELYGLKVSCINELYSFSDRNFEVLTDTTVAKRSGKGTHQFNHFILKIYNSKDSSDGNRIELPVNTMEYLWNMGFPCPLPISNRQQKLIQLETIPQEHTNEEAGCSGRFMVVLLTYLPGRTLATLASSPSDILVDVGRHLARFQLLLKGFENYSCTHPSTFCCGDWSLEKLPEQRHLLSLIEDDELRRDVERVVDLFEAHVVPVLPMFKQGIIHGDFNDHNILVDETKSDTCEQSLNRSSQRHVISGIIDYGEVAFTCIIFDIAIGIAEMMTMGVDDCFETAAHVLSGYESVKGIPDLEKDALYYLVLARCAQSILLRLEERKMAPDNEYIMESYGDCCSLIKTLLRVSKEEAEMSWNLWNQGSHHP